MADLCVLQSALDISAALLAAGQLFMDDSEDSDDSDNDAESERPGPGQGRNKGPRRSQVMAPTEDTHWWKFITSEEVANPTSFAGKLFRRRFRVSFLRFQNIVASAKTWTMPNGSPVFPLPRVSGRRVIPVEIKVLIGLRFIATGSSFDLIAELSETSETVARVSALKFCRQLRLNWGAEWCSPLTGDALKEQMLVFARCGFPGAVCSTDVVHLAWDRCPAGDLSLSNINFARLRINTLLMIEKARYGKI